MEIIRFDYGFEGSLASSFDQALEHTRQVLAKHGFGVQAEIDISKALKTKLGVDVPREIILGVCNPRLAHAAIQREPHITVLLPCNVTVKEGASGTHIAAASPSMLVSSTHNHDLDATASEAEKLLLQAFAEL